MSSCIVQIKRFRESEDVLRRVMGFAGPISRLYTQARGGPVTVIYKHEASARCAIRVFHGRQLFGHELHLTLIG